MKHGFPTAVRVLLVIAGIHQLGACACGHAEHNGWVQLIQATFCSACETEDLDGTAAVAVYDNERHQHDPSLGVPRLEIEAASGPHLANSADSMARNAAKLAGVAIGFDQPSAEASAPLVRAALQVFRI